MRGGFLERNMNGWHMSCCEIALMRDGLLFCPVFVAAIHCDVDAISLCKGRNLKLACPCAWLGHFVKIPSVRGLYTIEDILCIKSA